MSAFHALAGRVIRALLIGALALPAAALAQYEAPKRELIYGAELMSRAERDDYRNALQKAKGEDDAARIRERHREQMQKRAKARGDKLDERGLLEKDTPKDSAKASAKDAKK